MFVGNEITTDGLVWAVDAATDRSYVSGSNRWYDIVGSRNGNRRVGSFLTGSNGGTMVFDDTGVYTKFDFNSSLNITGSCTFEVMFKLPYGKSAGITSRLLGESSKYIFYTNTNTPATTIYQYIYYTKASTGGSAQGSHLSGLVNDKWYCNVFTADTDGSWDRYTNGSRNTGGTIADFSHWNTDFTVGWDMGRLVGETHVGFARIYDRALTATEVLYNWNQSKLRFGI